jgi:hypothetical protein
MNMTTGCLAEGSGVSRAMSVRSGALRSLPKRTATEYVVHDWILAAGDGVVLAVVDTGSDGTL